MAVPLRKPAGGYEALEAPRRPGGKAKQNRAKEITPKRLVRRQVRSNAEFRRTIAWVFLGMSSVLFMMGMTSTFVKAGVSRMNYSINKLQTENEQILLENDKIRGQIAELRSLERIEEIAVRDLGMVKNEQVEYMVLSTTIVAEGKIRATDEEAAEVKPAEAERETIKAVERILDFVLAILNK